MKSLYGLAIQTGQAIAVRARNSRDYLMGNYHAKKQERLKNEEMRQELIKDEEMRQAVITDYDSVQSDPKINTSSIDFNDGQHPDSLAGTA